MMGHMNRVHIILPATDETYSLKETVERASRLLSSYELRFLIVTSPKFTTEGCRAMIRELQARYGTQVEAFDQVRPRLGGAIQDAFDRVSGGYTVLMASDLETDPDALPDMLAALDTGADIAATTRWKNGGGFAGYNLLKLVLNYLFQAFFRTLYRTPLTDLTYGYRAYRTELLRRIR